MDLEEDLFKSAIPEEDEDNTVKNDDDNELDVFTSKLKQYEDDNFNIGSLLK